MQGNDTIVPKLYGIENLETIELHTPLINITEKQQETQKFRLNMSI